MIGRATSSYVMTIGGTRVKGGLDVKPREVSVHTLRRGQLQRRQRAISSLTTLRFSSIYSRGQDMVNDAISNCVLPNTVLFMYARRLQCTLQHVHATSTRKTPVLERDCTSLKGYLNTAPDRDLSDSIVL